MSRHKMPQMIFGNKSKPPETSYWVGVSREKLNELIATRLPNMQPAQASDFTYGPHRGGSGYGSLPAVKGVYSA